MAIKNYYAIANGRQINTIVDSWEKCADLVNGFPNARFKGFKWPDQAEAWLDKNKVIVKKTVVQGVFKFIPPTDKKDKFGFFKPKYYRRNGIQYAYYGKTIGSNYICNN